MHVINAIQLRGHTDRELAQMAYQFGDALHVELANRLVDRKEQGGKPLETNNVTTDR